MSKAREKVELVRGYAKYAELPAGLKFNLYVGQIDLIFNNYVVWTATDLSFNNRVEASETITEGMEELEDSIERVFEGLREVKAKVDEIRDNKRKKLEQKREEDRKNRLEKVKEAIRNIEIKVSLVETKDYDA